jgi:succinylglutamic semialdehyde dehydrogenase
VGAYLVRSGPEEIPLINKQKNSSIGRGNFVAGNWSEGSGSVFSSYDPVTREVVWHARSASPNDIDEAIAAARSAGISWKDKTLRDRSLILTRFAEIVKSHRLDLARLISKEVGKPTWEALAEVDSVAGKVAPTLEAYSTRIKEIRRENPDSTCVTRFQPYGVAAVIGPFNFPAHMPNGHIMPALLSGNTLILKPSELSPGVAEMMVSFWQEAGLPNGVLNLVQGGADVGRRLIEQDSVDAVYFTGSLRTGLAISKTLAETPWRIAALEMGGNSPLIVWDYADLKSALYIALYSAFVTAGQRCSAARRLIIRSTRTDFVEALKKATEHIRIGHFSQDPEPFMGPMIRREYAAVLLEAQDSLIKNGGIPICQARLVDETSALILPGMIDVTPIDHRNDEETLGPLLQVVHVNTFEEAIVEANRTKYGLAAGLVSNSKNLYHDFLNRVKAGILNWNQPLPGASSFAPFGGIKASGNNRPSGFFAVDYCSYPTASLESPASVLPTKLPPGLEL